MSLLIVPWKTRRPAEPAGSGGASPLPCPADRESPTRSAPPAWWSRGSARRWPEVLLLLAFCVFLFFYGIGAGQFYRTESLRAIIAAEFLRSGNWVVPTLYGEPFFSKPPGMYAAIALASWPGGRVTEWTARLPSALAATCAVLLFYRLFNRHLGRPAGLVAAVLLPLSFLWLDKATAAEIDMLQVAWVMAALLCYARVLEVRESSPAASLRRLKPAATGVLEVREGSPAGTRRLQAAVWFWSLAALLAVAGGVLTKWTAPAFFYGTLVPWLWWRGRLRLLFGWPHLAGVALGMGICLLWVGLAVSFGGWEAFYVTVRREALMHLSPAHHHRPYPWLESLAHPFRVLTASLPVSAFALVSLWPGFARCWDARGRCLLQLLHCWTWPSLLFWSAVPEHGVRQSFPLFPGLAGLAAMVWVAWLTGRWAWRWPRFSPGRVLVTIVCVWLVVKLGFVHGVVPARDRKREPRHKAEQVAALVPRDEVLYLFRLKDEGIMFYYGRTVRRLQAPVQLPSAGGAVYAILDEPEWERYRGAVEPLLHLQDEQGAPIALVRFPQGGASPGLEGVSGDGHGTDAGGRQDSERQ